MTNPFDEPTPPATPRRGMFARLRASFFTGLVVVAPIGLTAYLIWTVTGWFDGWVLNFVPRAYHPGEFINRLLGYNDPTNQLPVNVRGIGVIIFLIFTVIVGWLAKGLLGRSFIRWAEALVDRTPVVNSVYNGLKQIAETVFAQSETSFDQACMIEYPRKGTWAIGFVSTSAKGEIAAAADDETDPLISIFVPTTPNPTSGFLLFFKTSEVKILDMTVEDAAKLVISAGLVYPNGKDGAPSVPSKSATKKSKK